MLWSVQSRRWLAVAGVVAGLGLGLSGCGGGASTDVPGASETRLLAGAEDGDSLLERGARLNAAELARAQSGGDRPSAAPEPSRSVTKAVAGDTRVAVFRFFNTATGTHFYTASVEERDRIVATLPVLRYEGPAFHASSSPATALSPVYRFYNSRTGVHFYTISEDERNHILANLPQYVLEGVAYHASKLAGDNLLKPLFRFYILSKGVHFFTASASEADNIRATLPDYRYEGIAYHVLRGPTENAPGKIYKGLAAPTTQSGALAQATSEGALGYTYVTDYFFSSATQQGAIYFSDQAQPRTYQPRILSTAVTSAAGKVTALNVQGGLGYGYQGDVFFSGNGFQAYARHVKPTPGSGNMSYVAQPLPGTADGLATLLNQQGAQGFRYLGPVIYSGVSSALFERSSTRPGPFSYRLLASATSAAGFEAAANAQGTEGFAFKGPLMVGASSYDLYARDGGRYALFRYRTAVLNPADSMAAVINALNAEGARGYYWFGPMSFGGTTYSVFYLGNYVCPPLGGCSTPDGL
jgi:hypothetical protein